MGARNFSFFSILWFYYAEDHGWGYRIYHNRQKVASFDISFELGLGLCADLIEKLYPEKDQNFYYESLESKNISLVVMSSKIYKLSVKAQYCTPPIEQFSLFGLGDDILQKLKLLLVEDWYFEFRGRWEQVYEFKKILNLEEMDWVSYRYLLRG